MPSSRGSSQSTDQTQAFCIAGRFFTAELQGKPKNTGVPIPSPVDLPNPGIELGSPALQVDFLPAELTEVHYCSKGMTCILNVFYYTHIITKTYISLKLY